MPTAKSAAGFGTRDTSKVPFRITDEQYIPAKRYTDQAFQDLEVERLWRKSWQVACREEELLRVGDYVEYKIGEDSILVVRTKTDEVKGFFNACRHRGTQLGQGCGSFPTGQIVCPFHGWEFDLEGNNTYIYSPEGFRADTIEPDKVRLRPVQTATKWGLVWINIDLSAPGLDDYLGDISPTIDPVWLDKMRVRWWKQVKLKANWKVAQEAFFESYHVMQSHPEISLFGDRGDLRIDIMDMFNPRVMLADRGHWSHCGQIFRVPENLKNLTMHAKYSNAEFAVARNRTLWVGAQATMTQRVYDIQEEMIAEGVPLDDNFIAILRQRAAEDCATRNVPFPQPGPEASTWSHVFPNMTFLTSWGSCLMYRSRPDGTDPNACIYDFWSLEMVPEGTPQTRPIECSDEFFEGMWLVHQDKGNIERQQVGLRSSGGYTENRLAFSYEETISFFHRYLDQVLAKEPAETAA